MASSGMNMAPPAGAGLPASGGTDDSQGVGSKASGYAGPENGPFSCGNCQHFDGQGSCDNPKVQSDPEVNGQVDADGCCNFFLPGTKQAGTQPDDQGAAVDLSQGARFPKPAAGTGGY